MAFDRRDGDCPFINLFCHRGFQGAIDGSGLSAMDQTQSEKATKASLESVRAGERLMDCIDIAFVEQVNCDTHML